MTVWTLGQLNGFEENELFRKALLHRPIEISGKVLSTATLSPKPYTGFRVWGLGFKHKLHLKVSVSRCLSFSSLVWNRLRR